MEKILKAHMPAVVSPERSRLMSKIKGSGNRSTELRLRMYFVRQGIKGWKLRPQGLPGHPDFYFPKKKIVVFVDGCFWHGCPRCYKRPKTNQKFWNLKVEANKKRDRKNGRYYRGEGHRVVRIWEHELNELRTFTL